MAALTFLSCLFAVGTSCVIIGAALPEWFHQSYAEHGPRAYISGGPWSTCYVEPATNVTHERCLYRTQVHYDNPDHLLYARLTMALMTASLGVSLLALLGLVGWVHVARNKTSFADVKQHRHPAAYLTATLTLTASLLAVAVVVVFHRTLHCFTDVDDTTKLAPFWLVVGGAAWQGVMALGSVLLVVLSRRGSMFASTSDSFVLDSAVLRKTPY